MRERGRVRVRKCVGYGVRKVGRNVRRERKGRKEGGREGGNE